MTKKEALDRMYETYKKTPHLCGKCAFGLYLMLVGRSNWLVETTQDVNGCDLFYKADRNDNWAVSDSNDNNRVSIGGFRTEDNGAGYWITECPYYQELIDLTLKK